MRGLLAAAADGANSLFQRCFAHEARALHPENISSSGVCEIRFRGLRWAYLIDCIFLLLAIAFVPLLHPPKIPLLLPATLFFGWQGHVHGVIAGAIIS